METMILNHWAVLTAAISDLAVGALWYSPLLFYKPWLKANKLTEDNLKEVNLGKVYGLTLLLSLVISYNMAFFLGDASTDMMWGLTAGFLTGFGFAATSFVIIALYELKSIQYMLINSGYLIIAFSIKGMIIGAWR